MHYKSDEESIIERGLNWTERSGLVGTRQNGLELVGNGRNRQNCIEPVLTGLNWSELVWTIQNWSEPRWTSQNQAETVRTSLNRLNQSGSWPEPFGNGLDGSDPNPNPEPWTLTLNQTITTIWGSLNQSRQGRTGKNQVEVVLTGWNRSTLDWTSQNHLRIKTKLSLCYHNFYLGQNLKVKSNSDWKSTLDFEKIFNVEN